MTDWHKTLWVSSLDYCNKAWDIAVSVEESEDNCLKKDLFVAKIAEIQYSSFHVKCNLCKIFEWKLGVYFRWLFFSFAVVCIWETSSGVFCCKNRPWQWLCVLHTTMRQKRTKEIYLILALPLLCATGQNVLTHKELRFDLDVSQ